MNNSGSKHPFWAGVKGSVPFLLIVAPFSLVFGVFAADAGLNMLDVLMISTTVFAAAAQFTALQLLQDDAPAIIAFLSALALNLRMAIYSASLVPHFGQEPFWRRAFAASLLVDQNYAVAMLRYETGEPMSSRDKWLFYMGAVALIFPLWCLLTAAGTVIGGTIPGWIAFDFALPITFLAMIGPMLRTPAHIAAALAATTVALLSAPLPLNGGLFLGGIIGMMTGAEVERRMTKTEPAQ